MAGPNCFRVIAIILLLCSVVQSARILCFHPSPSKSHIIISRALATGLAERGHEVTMVSSQTLDKPVKNLRNIQIKIDPVPDELISRFLTNNMSLLTGIPMMNKMSADAANVTLNSPQFRKLMQNEKFDLIIYGYFVNEFIFGLNYHFKCPSIVLLPFGTMGFTNSFIGNPQEVATVPQKLLDYKLPMTFLQRTANFLAVGVEQMVLIYSQWLQRKYYNCNFPADKYPPYGIAIRNISLILANDHFSQGLLRPNLPNMIEVGGLQVKTKPNPLPEDIQAFLDGAEHGVIYFSLGSNLKSQLLEQAKLNAIVQTFAKMKQRVVFKWEADKMPGQSANMLIGKWLPQDDILAHKNVKLFVSHGGLGSVAEAKYHGVPIVGIPVFGDQKTNMHRIHDSGWGRMVAFDQLTEASFSAAVHEVLDNPKYTEEAKKLSELFRDRPQTAMDTAIYWVEYVIRHNGAFHMRYQGVDLNLLQAASIDVILFLGAVSYITVKFLSVICKFIFRQLFRGRRKMKVN